MFVKVIKLQHAKKCNMTQVNIKNLLCYFFDGMINIKNFDPNLFKITELSFWGVFSVNIYYIKYITGKS